MSIESILVFDHIYSGEEVADIPNDVSEMFDYVVARTIPVDEYGLHAGQFKVTVTWEPTE